MQIPVYHYYIPSVLLHFKYEDAIKHTFNFLTFVKKKKHLTEFWFHMTVRVMSICILN